MSTSPAIPGIQSSEMADKRPNIFKRSEKPYGKWLYKFFKWRYKHLSNAYYIGILSVLVGLITGLAAVTVKNFTHFIEVALEADYIHNIHRAFYFIFPVIGIGMVLLVIEFIIKRPVDSGIPFIMYAIARLKSIIPSYHAYASLLTAPLTVGFGGSVGLEGPASITGAAISSGLSKLLHLNLKHRNLLLGAAAAGTFASIFKAPVAGILFAVEILAFDLTMTSLVPLVLASVSAVLTSYFFLGKDILLHYDVQTEFLLREVPFFILLGVISAVVSIYFVKVYYTVMRFFERFSNRWLRWALAGSSLGLVIFLFPTLYGEGYEVLNHILRNDSSYILETSFIGLRDENALAVIVFLMLLVLFKVIAMTLTFSAGGVGGVFAPTLFAGGLTGYVFVVLFNHSGITDYTLSTENYVLTAMAGSIAGVLHAPLTAVFMIAEISGGYDLIIPIMLVSTLSFLISKSVLKYSIYTMQLAEIGAVITHDKDKLAGQLIEWDEVVENNFIPVHPEMSLGDLVKNAVIKSKRNIFPVLDENGRFLAVLTLDDIRQIMFDKELYDNVFVKDLMHKAPEVIHYKKDRFPDIMRKFGSTGAWNLPVVQDDRYIGFISKSKLLNVYRKKLLHITSE